MIPGLGRGANPKQMKAMMRKMGITMEEMEDVQEVIIKTASGDYVVRDAAVTKIDTHGETSFQVMGSVEKIEADGKPSIPQEDIDLVASKADVSDEKALQALKECDGNPAEAIIKLLTG